MTHLPPVPSPCVSVCRMEPDTGLCTGCLRTIDEIASWGAASRARKLAVWAEIETRRAARAPAPTGSPAPVAPPSAGAPPDTGDAPSAAPWKPAR